MAKSHDAFRTISEVAELLDVPAHVLRFWESKFSQVRPVKRAGGRRYYRPADVSLLSGIRKLLHDDGMTIKGVQKVLREQGIASVTAHQAPAVEALLQPPAPATPPRPAAEATPAPAAAPPTDDATANPAPAVDPILVPESETDNIVPFSLDRPAHQPSLFEGDEPPATAARCLAAAASARPGRIRRQRKRIVPLIARLEQVKGMLQSTP